MRMYRTTVGSLTCLAALLWFTGCEQPSPYGGPYGTGDGTEYSDLPVMISTDAPSYPAGAQVSIRLTNRTVRPVGYNLCRSSLEREDEGSWRPMQNIFAEACNDGRRVLAPGQGAFIAFKPDPHTRRGRYRIRVTFEELDRRSQFDVVSNAFALTRDSD